MFAPASSTAAPEADQGGNGLPKSLDQLDQKRRGVKPGSKRGTYNKPSHGGAPAAAVEPSAPAFTPESVRPVVSLPFNLAFVRTGFEGFLLSDLEAANLSHAGAMVFNSWIAVDPKYLALITFSLALASISVEKTMLYRKALVEFAQEQEKKRRAAEQEPKANG
jgi:hypothetical protein